MKKRMNSSYSSNSAPQKQQRRTLASLLYEFFFCDFNFAVCQGPATVDTPQDIFFFHFAVNLREDRDYFKWTTFITNKTYLTFPGSFTESEKNDKWAFVRKELLFKLFAFTHTKKLS